MDEHPSIDIAAEFIGPRVGPPRDEIRHGVCMGIMEFNGIEPGLFCPPGAVHKLINDMVALFPCQISGHFSFSVDGMSNLQADFAIFPVNRVHQLFQPCNMEILADLQAFSRMNVVGTYAGMLCHNQAYARPRPVHIMLYRVLRDFAFFSG